LPIGTIDQDNKLHH